jgi:hypothetical protein
MKARSFVGPILVLVALVLLLSAGAPSALAQVGSSRGWDGPTVVNAPALKTPILESPANNSTVKTLVPQLIWKKVLGAAYYDVEVLAKTTGGVFYDMFLACDPGSCLDPYVSTIKLKWNVPKTCDATWYECHLPLKRHTKYWWQVRACDAGGNCSAWSTRWAFTTY